MSVRASTTISLAAAAAFALAGCGGGDGPSEPNQQPTATITSPATGSSFDQGEAVTFEGSASDPEDGQLVGDALVWTSDVDGRLGTGTRVTVPDLSAGDHAVTLEATDSEGATGSDQVSLSVGAGGPSDQAELRAGLLAALPGGALVDETVDVAARIRNTGGVDAGGFDWRITVDGGQVASGRVDGIPARDSVELQRVTDLGPFAQGNHTVRLEIDTGDEVAEGSEGNNEAEDLLPVYPRGMDIEYRFLTTVSDGEREIFREAADRWETLVPGDLRDVAIDSADTSQCIEGGPVIKNDTLDDLLVLARLDSIDGEGNVLARAGPCFVRSTPPENIVIGLLEADSADFLQQRQAGRLQELLVHELAHVLGFGTLWESRGLVAIRENEDPFYIGRQAREAFDQVGGDVFQGQPVPVEGFLAGQGTALGHWREEDFQNELMTGFLNQNSDNPLSVVSVASMGDLDLPTAPGSADDYTFPAARDGTGGTGAAFGAGGGPWELRIPAPLMGIDPATGRVELLRPARRP